MTSEFWAAVVGAVLGGGIAAGIQLLTIRHTQRERQRGLAYGLLFKVGQIYSHLRGFNQVVEKALAEGDDDDRASPWRVVQGFANVPSLVVFTPEEIALVLELRPGKTLDDLLMLDEKHNATVAAFQFYADRRNELMEALTPVQVAGQQVVAAPVPLLLQAKAAGLNRFIEDIRLHLSGDVGHALTVLQQIADIFGRSLNIEYTILPKQSAAPAGLDSHPSEQRRQSAQPE